MSSEEKGADKKISNEEIEQRITTLLEVYPIVSPSMLGIGLGPATVSATEWRPVLQGMIDKGLVMKWDDTHERAIGGTKYWTKIALKPTYEAFLITADEMAA